VKETGDEKPLVRRKVVKAVIDPSQSEHDDLHVCITGKTNFEQDK
jgi:hypothetical protein